MKRCEDCICGRVPERPCEACRYLLASDAFSGVDARHEVNFEPPVEPDRDRDPYEFFMELGT